MVCVRKSGTLGVISNALRSSRMAQARELVVQQMIWQLRGLNPEAVDLWGDLTTFFKACMKTESLQKMVFSWMEKIFRETLTLEHFFCAFIYSIDCSIVLQKDDVLMLVGVRRDQMDGYWKSLVNRWYKMHHQRRRDPHHRRNVGLQCCNLHKML